MKRNISVLGTFAAVLVLGAGHIRAQTSATNESWSSCTSTLCIDAPPEGPKGLDGSGGWGWNNVANAPVTSLAVGKAAWFTVTMLQPLSLPYCNGSNTVTITLTYSSQDFSLSALDSGGNAGVSNAFDRGGVSTYTYSGNFLCHTDQSMAYSFTPKNPTNTALVTATITVFSAPGTVLQQASETFPVQIIKPQNRQ